MDERIIFHIDVNSAFLSWESIYRLQSDPAALDLRTIAAAVGGDPADRRGIVLAKSIAAKECGVTTGEPLTAALQKCPPLMIVPARFVWYTKQSKKLIQVLENYSPSIEKFSIDEAFLDMTKTIHLFATPVETANLIRQQIKQELGFTVNIGISSNKLLAKMASDFRKPNLCHTLFPAEVKRKMWPLPVGSLFFVGPAAEVKLEQLGIHTIGALANSNLAILKSHLGGKYASLIHNYANGIDHEPVDARPSEIKGYGNSITLANDITDFESAYQVLLSLSETIGARLRADQMRCSCICVELKDWQFQTHSHQITLSSATDSTSVIYQYARQLIHELWNLTPIRLIGIRTSKVAEDSFTQLSLFEDTTSSKMQQLEKTVDSIRGKFGIDSIRRASFLTNDAILDHASGKQKHLPIGDD